MVTESKLGHTTQYYDAPAGVPVLATGPRSARVTAAAAARSEGIRRDAMPLHREYFRQPCAVPRDSRGSRLGACPGMGNGGWQRGVAARVVLWESLSAIGPSPRTSATPPRDRPSIAAIPSAPLLPALVLLLGYRGVDRPAFSRSGEALIGAAVRTRCWPTGQQCVGMHPGCWSQRRTRFSLGVVDFRLSVERTTFDFKLRVTCPTSIACVDSRWFFSNEKI